MRGNNQTPMSQVRIIAGQWRGRKITFPDNQDIRPTPDRVRETLFNWLQWDLEGADCLDLFAGSGALGFEALSRGANKVTLIEKDSQVASNLKKNGHKLETKACKLIQADAIHWLQTEPAHPQDIIFCDPPFGKELLRATTQAIEGKGWLKPHGLIYCEAEGDLDSWPVPQTWAYLKHKKAGQVQYALFQRSDEL